MSALKKLQGELRELRGRYDALKRGRTAAIRHCKTAEDLVLEPVYWQVAGPVAYDRRGHDLPHVVLLFPLAPQLRGGIERFSFGRFLRRQLGDKDGAALRFRRLMASADLPDLDHRLRGVLRLACGLGAPVDWGVLGADILWFFHEGAYVRRRWAQDFYAPIASVEAPTPSTST
jgi:CRISPR type I-E-associated protein CasB/Cse2